MRVLFFLSSIFTVAYAWGSGSDTCEQYTGNKASCMKASESGVKCAYCTSAAVGSLCAPEDQAKGLPSSVFKCEYQAVSDAAIPMVRKTHHHYFYYFLTVVYYLLFHYILLIIFIYYLVLFIIYYYFLICKIKIILYSLSSFLSLICYLLLLALL